MLNMPISLSVHTTRIGGNNPYTLSANLASVNYASVNEDTRPGVIILVSSHSFQEGLCATSLIHFPHDGPILFTESEKLNPVTKKVISQLNPKGVMGIHVFIIGSIQSHVDLEIKQMGFNVYRIQGNSYEETAAQITSYLHYPETVMVVSGESNKESLFAGAFAAHMGLPILFVKEDSIPVSTATVLTHPSIKHVYIIGGTNSISPQVEQQLQQIKPGIQVSRIGGSTAADTAVQFIKYHDMATMFGWGFTTPNGYSFSFFDEQNWHAAVCASLLGHRGKHAPLLPIRKNKVPAKVIELINQINPATGSHHPPFMHGYIIGEESEISKEVQADLDRALDNAKFMKNKRVINLMYRLKEGENIQTILSSFPVTYEELTYINPGVNLDKLTEGKTLTIPNPVVTKSELVEPNP